MALGPAPGGARSRCRDHWRSFAAAGLEGLQVLLEVQEAALEKLMHVLGSLDALGARQRHRARR